tara:strand:- start:12789 stop:13517 length:729 start_codon:yes stop_codon:yes gene_type:complete
MKKFIIRIDDVHEGMDFVRFNDFINTLNMLEIKPIIGVIPNNKDNSLITSNKTSKSIFWNKIRGLYESKKCDIALHGYDHIYLNNSRGILKYGRKSEFSNVDYKIQYEKIKKGLDIFNKNGIKTKLFMAPSHTFDLNTIKVLNNLGIKYITDGFNLYPYKKFDIIFFPHLFSSFLNFGFGLYTICIHLDTMSEKDYIKLKSKLITHLNNITSFSKEKKNYNKGFISSLLFYPISFIFKFLRR